MAIPPVSVLSVADLDGSNGTRIAGSLDGDRLGRAVTSIGDIDGDGIDDFAVSATNTDGVGSNSGSLFVVFGRESGFDATLDPRSVNGTNGFRIDGYESSSQLGFSADGGGDVNGDGIADLVVSAHLSSTNGATSGAAYVLFGSRAGFGALVDLMGLDGTNGFVVTGPAGSFTGHATVSAGDFNGDGFDDLAFGAYRDSQTDFLAGAVHVVLGAPSGRPSLIDATALTGADGFSLLGAQSSDFLGFSADSAGDINGDGLDDLVLGAHGAGLEGRAYVVFGSSVARPASALVTTLDGSNGFVIEGAGVGNSLGREVRGVGDVNGDGLADLAVVANLARPNGPQSGATYLIYGRSTGFGATLPVADLTAATGTRFDGLAENDTALGAAVGAAGDVNGDGIDDLIIGAGGADAGGPDVGAAYVIFGRLGGLGATFDLGALNGTNGFRLDGAETGANFGSEVSSAGDVNGDGFDDILVGAFATDGQGTNRGEAFLVLGRATGAIDRDGTEGADRLGGGDWDDALRGLGGDDTIRSGGGDDTLTGGTGADRMLGGAGDDLYSVDHAGDRVVEAADEGTDRVEATVSLTLADHVEHLTLLGSGALSGRGNGLANRLLGTSGDNLLAGLAGNDSLQGGGGRDRLQGGAGNDALRGGAGDDILNGHAGRDLLLGHAGADRIAGGGGNDRASGGAGNDALRGGTGNDRLSGDAGNDTLTGDAGADRLKGGGGQDRLSGGLGRDQLTGGAGADSFVWRSAAEATGDRITDFRHGVDQIDLSRMMPRGSFAGDDFGGRAQEVIYDRATGRLQGDMNGDGRADWTVIVTNRAAIDADDLLF